MGPPDLARRDEAGQHGAGQREQQGDQVHASIGNDRDVDRKLRKGLPTAQRLQQHSGHEGSHATRGDRDQNRLGE